jgi:hypothetical protein
MVAPSTHEIPFMVRVPRGTGSENQLVPLSVAMITP